VSLPVLLGIGLLGGLGSIGRVVLAAAVDARAGRGFPWGILLVNVSGSLVLGLVAGAALTGDARRLAATGLLGSYTTFSTWMLDSRRLAGDGRRSLAALNVAGSLALGLGAVWLGRRIGASL
jgi:CrcB protein